MATTLSLPAQQVIDLPNVTPVIYPGIQFPMTLAITKGTVAVETTCSSADDINAGTAQWKAWAAGPKAAPYDQGLPNKVMALRFTASVVPAQVTIIP